MRKDESCSFTNEGIGILGKRVLGYHFFMSLLRREVPSSRKSLLGCPRGEAKTVYGT